MVAICTCIWHMWCLVCIRKIYLKVKCHRTLLQVLHLWGRRQEIRHGLCADCEAVPSWVRNSVEALKAERFLDLGSPKG